MQFPEQTCTQLQIYIKLKVTRLVYKIDALAAVPVTARTESPHAPATHTIGTAGKVTLFKRQDTRIAVRIRNSDPSMEKQGIAVVEPVTCRDVKVSFHILGVCKIQYCVLSVTVL